MLQPVFPNNDVLPPLPSSPPDPRDLIVRSDPATAMKAPTTLERLRAKYAPRNFDHQQETTTTTTIITYTRPPMPGLMGIDPVQRKETERLRGENYEYKTGTTRDGIYITNRPELDDENYDPSEWVPADNYNRDELAQGSLNPQFTLWHKPLVELYKSKPVKPGRQMMKRKPKAEQKGLAQEQKRTEEKKEANGESQYPIRIILAKMNELFSKFEPVVKKPRQMQMMYNPNGPKLTVVQQWKLWIQEEGILELISDFEEWMEIHSRLNMLLFNIGFSQLMFDSNPGTKRQEEICHAIYSSTVTNDSDLQFLSKYRPNSKAEIQQQQVPQAKIPEIPDRFYADCTPRPIQVTTTETVFYPFEISAEEFNRREREETERNWYAQLLAENNTRRIKQPDEWYDKEIAHLRKWNSGHTGVKPIFRVSRPSVNTTTAKSDTKAPVPPPLTTTTATELGGASSPTLIPSTPAVSPRNSTDQQQPDPLLLSAVDDGDGHTQGILVKSASLQ